MCWINAFSACDSRFSAAAPNSFRMNSDNQLEQMYTTAVFYDKSIETKT